jgi:hypothetical protein
VRVGRGLGLLQRAILTTLEETTGEGAELWALTVAQLAERTGRSARQVRHALDALESRGLVVVSRHECISTTPNVGRWQVEDESPWQTVPEGSEIVVIHSGERYPDGYTSHRETASRDVRMYRAGMPKVGSLVALPERWVAHECRQLSPPGATS